MVSSDNLSLFSTKGKVNMEWSYEMMWGKVEILMTLIWEDLIEKVTFEGEGLKEVRELVMYISKETDFWQEEIASANAQGWK